MPPREVFPASVSPQLPATTATCRYCYTGRIENKTYIQCNACAFFVSFISRNRSRNRFVNFHIEN